jgi:hypothetical protein
MVCPKTGHWKYGVWLEIFYSASAALQHRLRSSQLGLYFFRTLGLCIYFLLFDLPLLLSLSSSQFLSLPSVFFISIEWKAKMAALTTKPTSIEDLAIYTNAFLNNTTIYLSTLSAPIEPLEELLAVSGLTNSLLQALQSTIQRFDLSFHPTSSFINPLTQDILSNLDQLRTIVQDARSSRVWESNAGVHGAGRVSWCTVCGNEENAKRLRSRFFVEKYRVRVLIDAVSWFALRNIQHRSQEQEIEYQEVGKRLGTVAERLVGVWRDYTPRLKALEASQRSTGCGGVREGVRVDLSEMQRQRVLQLQMMNQAPVLRQNNAPPRYEAMPSSSAPGRHCQTQIPAHVVDEKRVPNQANSCGSCSR